MRKILIYIKLPFIFIFSMLIGIFSLNSMLIYLKQWSKKNQDKIRDEFINPKSGKVWKVIKNTYPKIVIHLNNVDRAYLSDKELVKQAVVTNPSNIKYVFSINISSCNNSK